MDFAGSLDPVDFNIPETFLESLIEHGVGSSDLVSSDQPGFGAQDTPFDWDSILVDLSPSTNSYLSHELTYKLPCVQLKRSLECYSK